jgi:FKBP-type peptidyl-prolyl cis-trans isomerase FkpA
VVPTRGAKAWHAADKTTTNPKERTVKFFPLLIVAAVAAGCAAERPRVETPPPKAAPVAACEPAPRTLVVRDTKPGNGKVVEGRSAVLVGYTGWIYDPKAPDCKGVMFDTSTGRPTPFGFMVGAGRVIKGWDQGLIGMRENGRRTLIIPPDMAYGDRGAGDKIPPGSTLLFEIELFQITWQPDSAAPAAPAKPPQ